jgi:hypothetical protein
MRRIVFVTLLAACSSDVTVSDLEAQADSINSCCQIHGNDIGRENHLVKLGSNGALVHDWIAKPGSPGKYLGFSLTVAGSVRYVVTAGSKNYDSTSVRWSDGDASIGLVDFCGSCDDPDGCGHGGGGGGSGSNPGGGGNPL